MSQERILVLESDPALLEQICKLLGDRGYSVVSADSRARALAVPDLASFDLFLCDVSVRNKSGLSVHQELRRANPDIAAVVLTQFDNWEIATEALRSGFAGFVFKPFEPEELVAAAAAALEQEKLRRENSRLRALVPLYELSRLFIGAVDLDEVLGQIVSTARLETRSEVVSLMLLDADGRTLNIAAANGLDPAIVESQRPQVGSGIAGWVAAHGRPLQIGEGIPLDKSVRQAMGKPELLSALSLPLKVRGETIGVLNLGRKRGAEVFAPADLELASVLAGQAAIALDKARLIQDLRSLTETSQKLASALDLDEAASIVLAATAQAAQASGGAFWLVEEISEQLELSAALNLTPPIRPPAVGVRALDGAPRIDEAENKLWLPIGRGEEQFGLIELRLASSAAPRPDRLDLLRTLAQTAVGVIESHRLRAREAIAFRELGEALHTDLNLHQVLDRVLAQMVEACRATGGSILLQGERGGDLKHFANSGEPAPVELAEQVLRDNQPLLFSRYSHPDHRTIHSVAAVPLNIGSRVEGAIVLYHRQSGAFASRHLNLLSVLGNSTALIVRNAQLYARSEEAVIAEERTRIAREIHDGLAQDLSLLLIKVEIMRRLMQKGDVDQLEKEMDETTAALRNDLREVRRTIFALRPLDLESLGFLPALDKFVREFGQANDIKMHLTTSGETAEFAPKVQTALFRLAQESLNNIRKHAKAMNVWLELEVAEGWATLLVRDDGRGFEPERALSEARRRGSVGLVQMQERAERAGGAFEFQTAPGQGTLIRVRLPVN